MKKITVYTTDFCPYCVAAKKLLSNKNLEFEEVNVQNDWDKRSWLVETTGQRTVPQIFIGDQSIGGFDDLSALDQKGQLDQILNSD